MLNAGRRSVIGQIGILRTIRHFSCTPRWTEKSQPSPNESIDKKSQILIDGLKVVPDHGFDFALTLALRQHGYSDASRNLFSNGAYDLIQFHLNNEKDALSSVPLADNATFMQNTQALVLHRLMTNKIFGAPSRLSEALAIMTLPNNIAGSLNSLHELSDEIAWLAGDKSTDFSWYTRRAAISTLYACSEVFQSQDTSKDYSDTTKFLSDRVGEIDRLNYAGDSVVEWIKFNTVAPMNVLKSLTRG
jgi:ubiquinone biosynthesis protein COQ9